jgi:hydrogenase-4 component F
MGIIALGIGFGTPLALAGVALHIVAHAVAKAMGFYLSTPLLDRYPRAKTRAVSGIGRTDRRLGLGMGVTLGALAGLPPSPLFVSEVLIVAGGFEAGRYLEASLMTLLLALGFIGLLYAMINVTVGKIQNRPNVQTTGRYRIAFLVGTSVVLLVGLAVAAPWLIGSGVVEALAGGSA